MRGGSLLVLVVAAGCAQDVSAPGHVNPPPAASLPPAQPGVVVPVQAGQSRNDFPTIGWDLDDNALVSPAKARQFPNDIVRVDLVGLTKSTDTPTAGAVTVLHSGGWGVVLYTDGAALWELDGTTVRKLTATTRVQFGLSDNGQWVVFHDNGWQLMERATGTVTVLPTVTGEPVAIADDGTRVAFGMFATALAIAVVDVGTSEMVTVPSTGLLADGMFQGGELHLLTMTREEVANGSTYRFFDQSGSGAVAGLGEMTTEQREVVGGPAVCGRWSHGPGPRTAVAAVQINFNWPAFPSRFNFFQLGGTPRLFGSADLWTITDCSLSPDGRWFVYGESSGNYNPGRLFLRAVQ